MAKKDKTEKALAKIEERLDALTGTPQEGAGDGFYVPPMSGDLDAGDDSEEVLDRAISTLPPVWDNCYCKIYKVRPLPPGVRTPPMLGSIEDLRDVKDMELHLQSLVKDGGWGSGTYRLGFFQDSGRGEVAREWRTLEVQVPTVEQGRKTGTGNGNGNGTHTMPGSGSTPENSFLGQLQHMAAVQKTVRELVPPGPDPNAVVSEQMRTFQAGIELAKSQLGTSQQNNPLEIIMAMQQMGLLQPQHTQVPTPPPQPAMDPLTLLRAFKELLPPPPPTPPAPVPQDPWEGLRKLTELGVIDLRKKDEDPVGTMGKVAELFQVLSPFLGGGGERTTATTELIRTVGPQAGEIVGRVTDAVNNVVSLGKAKLQARLGIPQQVVPQATQQVTQQIQQVQRPLTSNTPTAPPAPPCVPLGYNSPVPPSTGEYPAVDSGLPVPTPIPISGASAGAGTSTSTSTQNPVIAQILSAARVGDTGFYPQLRELMMAYINPQIVDQLLSGAVSPATLLTSLANMTGEQELASGQCAQYLGGLLEWHRATVVVAKCEGCGEEFEVTKEEWGTLEGKVCECGGVLREVEVQG